MLTGLKLLKKQGDVFKDMHLREQITFRLHILYSLLDGTAQGVFALNEFVFLKSLHPSSIQVSLLFQVMSLLMPLSIFLIHIIRKIKNQHKLLIYVAILTKLPLLLFLFFPANAFNSPNQSWWIAAYLSIITLNFFSNPIILPVINLFTKNIYHKKRFGRLFSYNLTLTQVFWFIGTFIFGLCLDFDANAYRIVFPIIGLLSFIALYLISTFPYKPPQSQDDDILDRKSVQNMVSEVWKDTLSILKNNKAFAQFQLSMFLYGMGFLMALPIITLYLAQKFNLMYSEIGFYKNIPIIISILTYPVFGRLMDEKDPRRLAILSFSFALIFYVLLLFAGWFPFEMKSLGYRVIALIFLAYIAYGFFNSSIGLVWGIGSSYFAPSSQAATYHAIHISLTGVRAIIAPPLGILIYNLVGYYGSFIGCVGFEILAISTMYYSLKNKPIDVLSTEK